jgi:hypothetical protein
MNKASIYPYPVTYARENGELEQYQASFKTLAECKCAIDDAIFDNWDGMNFAKDSAKRVLKQFGPERVTFILAYTLREMNIDNRFSGHNASWASTVPLYGIASGRGSCTLESHPAKVDLFIDLVRKDLQELAQQKSASRQKSSVKSKKEAVKMDKTPIYKDSFEYAYQHGEEEQHRASNHANIACKEAIEKAIASHYHDNRLDTQAAVQEVVKQFGYERMLYVLANTVQTQGGDGRVSQSNKQWAQTVPIVFEGGRRDVSYLITRAHSGLLDMFVSQARHEFLLRQPLKAADIKAEAEHILKRIQEAQEPNSPNGTHYMAQVSPDFLARAKTRDTDRLMSMLPFQSLSLSKLEGRKGTYALILKEENRFQPLVLRRPSVKKKLQEKSAVSAAPSVPGKPNSKGQER